ncbi:MAG: YceI family protein [Betaproteobacteria bacterium]|nr:MAG: YceI family protein [Betaproteobacteria bacterium]
MKSSSPSRSKRIRISEPFTAGAAALLALGFAAAAAAAPVVYRIEPEFTYAEFAVSHIGLSRQRGHFGRTNGTIVLDPEQHSGSIDFVVDATSIDTGWNVRDEFLRGEAMFDAAHYPVIRFRSEGRTARVRQRTRQRARRLRRGGSQHRSGARTSE